MKNLIFIITLFLLFSCKKETKNDFSIVGTWIEYASDRNKLTDGTVSFDEEHITFIFANDNTGVEIIEGTLYKNTVTSDFTYEVNFETNRIIFKDSRNPLGIGSYLVISDENTIKIDNLILHKKIKG